MIVGISGYAGSGKSTLARHLAETHGFTRLSFATPIRQALIAMGVPESFLTDHKGAEIPRLGHTGRYLMQTLGTEWGRDTVNKNIWLYRMDDIINSLWGRDIVIDDVRFDSEADYIRRKNGFILNIVRGNTQLDPYDADHSSEAGVQSDLVNYKLENSGSVAAAVEKMDEIICHIASTISQPMT